MTGTRQLAVVAAAIAVLVAACAAAEVETTASPTSTTVEIPTSGALAQCAGSAEERIETVATQFDGLERSYDVVVPASSDPLPVVIAFHGFRQSSELHRKMTGLDNAALERGFVAVFPMGSIPEDGTRSYFNLATNNDAALADDVGFVEAILADIASEHCVDETRIYASGWSNGGMLASTLPCKIPDRFAAVASVSGLVFREDCPDVPVPIIAFHGTADSRIPYTEAPPNRVQETAVGLGANDAQAAMFGGIDEDPDDYIALWAAQNGCQPEPVEIEDLVYDIFEYQGCDQGADVESVLLEFGGHRWTRYPTELILDFLFEHQLPEAGEGDA